MFKEEYGADMLGELKVLIKVNNILLKKFYLFLSML